MCSLNDVDENGETYISQEEPRFSETTCRSCSNPGLIVLRKKDVYCKNCFLAAETHKFRAALGKSKLMKPQDRVLVAYSGSPSSSALLHFLYSGVMEDQHKKLLFSVFILYIDEGAILNLGIDKRKEIVESVIRSAEAYNFPVYITTLSESMRDSPQILNSSLIINENYDKQLIEMFTNIKSHTSKEDLLGLLKQQLILKSAEELNCNKVFTSEVGNDIAVKLLSNFSLGRGETASFESGFCDSRHPDIKLLRPLREFTKKEIIFYNRFHNVESITIPTLTLKSPANVSIKKLTEKFVTNLQEDFPSTVYTIFRTGEKLSSNGDNGSENICILCKNKMKTKNSDSYSAVEAAEFSKNVSRKKLNDCLTNGDCCANNCCKQSGTHAVDLEKFLCYGCTLIVRDMKNVAVLPEQVLKDAMEKKQMEEMREQISEFLIENSSEVEL